MEKEEPTETNLRRITRACCDAVGIDYDTVFTRTRKTEYVVVRQIAMVISRERLRASLNVVGKFFSRDYSTVIHAERSVYGKLDVRDMFMMQCYNACQKKVRDEFEYDHGLMQNILSMAQL